MSWPQVTAINSFATIYISTRQAHDMFDSINGPYKQSVKFHSNHNFTLFSNNNSDWIDIEKNFDRKDISSTFSNHIIIS